MINTSTVAHQGRWGVHSITAVAWRSNSLSRSDFDWSEREVHDDW